MKTALSTLLLSSFLYISNVGTAQEQKKVNFPAQEVSFQTIEANGTPQIYATSAKYFILEEEVLVDQLEGISSRESGGGFTAELSFPHPDGTFHTYYAKSNNTMHPELAKKFPEIKSFDANGTNGEFAKWDITQQGFHAMIFVPGQSTIYIDPVIRGNTQYYIVYKRENFVTDKVKDCSFNSDLHELEMKKEPVSGELKEFGTCELRTYRMAISATGEYTNFHGGTVADALAAQVTTMNRVNGVYEKDMAITMEIVPNNNLIIYTSTGSDPFTNGNPGAMINENQNTVTTEIGSANYDIGHVFGTNSGGLAGLGVVCSNSSKARGVTGSSAPINDPFDIDYVAHEVGHQFGANHTFNNSCSGNRNNSTAVEPGSGSTIMAYAGICSPNVQNNSNDHFSGISLEEISNEILSGGHQCETISALANSAPIIISAPSNVTIPAQTPFALTAEVTDADNDPITYNWEQMDTEISTQPPSATSTDGPNFRSWSSSTSETRYFPRLSAIKNNGPFTWERISDVGRSMNFRVTVRDNSPGPGGCNDHEDVSVTVDGNSGPFLVTYPNVLGTVWYETESRTVTWDIANTDIAPVNCTEVDIFLSTDGGNNFPTVLATNVPNTGSATITVPNGTTNIARVMVMSSQGTFFDMSDYNFIIAEYNVGLNELINSGVEIYPNPAKDLCNVLWEENVSSIELRDAQGKVLQSMDVTGLKNTSFSLENLSAGMYFINVFSDEGRSVHQLVKK